ncbi:hypothetical protein [Sphaerisporangium fuscum]|uniref:hypothetical protein n=1 Tax=Sphaerisporangium fuscum TaxID=2835868 RepID=UPI001BDC4047|nr:hypothetical protein [Sphaerisporangium fuscum]
MARTQLITMAVAGALAGSVATAALAISIGPASAREASVTVVEGPLTTNRTISTATCPEGMHVIGGGYRAGLTFTHGGSPADAVDMDAPALNGKGWEARANDGNIKARALCAPDD